jgi:hypothetical protein
VRENVIGDDEARAPLDEVGGFLAEEFFVCDVECFLLSSTAGTISISASSSPSPSSLPPGLELLVLLLRLVLCSFSFFFSFSLVGVALARSMTGTRFCFLAAAGAAGAAPALPDLFFVFCSGNMYMQSRKCARVFT